MYAIKPGARLKSPAEVIAAECNRLEAENRLTAKELVNESRPEEAPLHKEFEWRDPVAAENWREHQARHVINSVVWVREDNQEPVRAFFNIETTAPEYLSIHTILRQEDTRAALLKTALRELEAFQTKYNTLEELTAVFEAIKAVRPA